MRRSKHPAQSRRRARHAEPCHLHAARAALRRGQALRAQAGARDRLLGRARDPEGGSPDFVLLDVRGRAAYAKAHVPGATSLPHGEITAERMMAWPHDTLFVVYCAGPHCNGADGRR